MISHEYIGVDGYVIAVSGFVQPCEVREPAQSVAAYAALDCVKSINPP